MTDVVRGALESAAEAYAQRMEYELRGAWRAGYDYVHVYEKEPAPAPENLSQNLTVREYVLPTHGPARPDPPGCRYRFTYDLASVPDDVIRDVVRGDLDADELRRVKEAMLDGE